MKSKQRLYTGIISVFLIIVAMPGICMASELNPGENASSTDDIVLQYYRDQTVYYVNGQANYMDTAPFVGDGLLMLPVRYVITPLGGTAEWDPNTSSITINCKGHDIVMWLNQSTASVDGVMKPIFPGNPGITPISYNERTMVPLRFVGESLGCEVEWLPESAEAFIHFGKPYSDDGNA